VSSDYPVVAAPLSDAQTDRLSVRRLLRDDFDDLAELLLEPEMWQFDLAPEDTEAFLDRQLRLWSEFGLGGCAVRDLGDRRLLGVVGLAVPTQQHRLMPPVTIGWRFASLAWGKGFATEAASELLRQAFGPMRLNQVGCVTNLNNRRSVALARRLGMNAVAQEAVPSDGGQDFTALILRVDRNAWIALHPA
jgi:RimJ/RimL family protein N-acetyltransferase